VLILSRKPGESILLDGGIRVVVVACDRRGVRLGIEAPPEVSILRGEIADAIAEENRRAGAPPPESEWLTELAPPRRGPQAEG
jgi:carbon storage regulator